MNHLSDQELIDNIRDKNCSESLEVLAKRHAGMFYSMAKRFSHTNLGCSGVSIQDFGENLYFIVYQAAKKYDPEKKTKFVTWLGNQVRYYCLNTITAESKYYGAEPDKINFLINSSFSEETPSAAKIESESEYILGILDKLKDKRIKKIFELRYFSEDKKRRSFTYIAKKLNMSTQGAINLHDDFVKFIRRKMKATSNMDEI